MKLSANARTVLERRYLKQRDGRLETPEEMLTRVAKNIAQVEKEFYGQSEAETKKWESAFFQLMDEQKFLPNSPTLMNAGHKLQQLAACFVLPIEDSMESIFETLKIAALIHKSGGGTGFSFSRLRPKNDLVGSTGGVASGPLSFLKVYNASTEAVKQGGASRGANMGILRVDHPDIESFIVAKKGTGEYTNFNLSVAITDRFMEALAKKEKFPLVNPRTGAPVAHVDPQALFRSIAEAAWSSGEPGVIFIDRINQFNPTPQLGPIESTNPCGEQPLLPYEACNLGSINLSLFCREQAGRTEVDWEELKETIHTAIRFLDNTIDATVYPHPKIESLCKANRKIGLGVMGWAEMLIKMGLPYNSEQALALAEEVMSFIDRESKAASAALAEERGAFPNFKGSMHDRPGLPPLRNATTTTIAPTGSLSIIAGTTGGIEPLFSIVFTRQILDNDHLLEANPLFLQAAKERGFYSDELMQRIAEEGSLENIPEVPADLKAIFLTAHQIAPEWHIRMQAAFQKFTDNAVSKTLNFPRSATKEQVADAYLLAYQLGCKGVTIYRDGSIENQPMQRGLSSKSETPAETPPSASLPIGEWGKIHPLKRPVRLDGITDRKITPEGTLYLTLNYYQNRPFELFTQIGKAGTDIMAFTEAIARLISLAFRCGIDPEAVAEQLIGIGGSRSVGFGHNRVRSVPDAIGQFLYDFLHSVSPGQVVQEQLALSPAENPASTSGNRPNLAKNNPQTLFNLCPVCGMYTFAYLEGCAKCLACGHSEC
ncbi:MAG: vitamin B12-dependent ribonucleotide reductase [Firmicutes bacterium]|nr:vitamin B12-dependent ribonucleotide reductase [Bacillota bacterium]